MDFGRKKGACPAFLGRVLWGVSSSAARYLSPVNQPAAAKSHPLSGALSRAHQGPAAFRARRELLPPLD